MTRLLKFTGVALISGAIFGAVAALFSSALVGVAVGFVVGLLILGTAWIYERLQARPIRAGDRVLVDMGLEGDAKGVIESIWGPPGRPIAKVKLGTSGPLIDVPLDVVQRRRRSSR